MRRNRCHLILNFRADPQRCTQILLCARGNGDRCRFIANRRHAITQVAGVKGVGAFGTRNPCRCKVLLQHRNPAIAGGGVQVLVIRDGVEFILLIFRLAGGVGRATEGVQSKVVAAGITMLRQIDGLLQLAKQRHFQRLLGGVVDMIIDINGIFATLEDEGFGVNHAIFSGVGHRHTQFGLAISHLEVILRSVEQRTRAVVRVIRAITTGQTTLCLIKERWRCFKQLERLVRTQFVRESQQLCLFNITASGVDIQ